jgi:hypothetical protein
VLEIVPHAEPEHPVPETLHVTFVLAPLPVLLTMLVICCNAPSSTLAFCAGAVMLTATSLVTVTAAEADDAPFATLVARMLTVTGEGRMAGAVYTPAALIVPTVEFPPLMPFTLHVTAVFDVPETVAVNGCCAPSNTFTDRGDIVTVMVGGGGGEPPPPPPPHPAIIATSASAMEIAAVPR